MSNQEIQLITHSAHVESLLAPYRPLLGVDFEGYRGHIYRVLTYTLYLLQGEDHHRATIETALVYHDLGLWTDRKLAYLEPSCDRVEQDLEAQDGEIDRQLVHDLIFYHHKILTYRGPHERLVNAVRKADWVDATNGLIRKGIPRRHIQQVKAALPAAGFHQTLARLARELSGGNPFRMVAQFARVFKL